LIQKKRGEQSERASVLIGALVEESPSHYN